MAACATGEQAPTGAFGGDTSDGGASSTGGGAHGGHAGSTSTAGTTGSAGTPSNGGSNGAQGGTTGAGGSSAKGGSSSTGGSSSGGSSTGGSSTGGKSSGGASAGGTTSGGTSSGGSSAGGSSAGGSSSGGTGGGSASGTVLFGDDFEDGNANGWVTSGGTWAVATDGTKVYAQTATGTGSTVLLSAAGSVAWTDQIVEARVKATSFGGQSTSYFVALYARFTGPASNNSYYSVLLRSDGKLVIRKGNSSIGSSVSANIVTGTWYTVRLECVGSNISAYLNGVLQSTVVDSSITSGGIAVAMENASAEFDDIKVTTP